MTETNEPLIVDIDLKESDLQRANFWFRLGKWSTRLSLVMLCVAGLLLLWRFQSSNLLENLPATAVVNTLIIIPGPVSTTDLVSNETRLWKPAGFPNHNSIFILAEWLHGTRCQILRRHGLGRNLTRRRIKTFVPSLLSQIVFSYNTQAVFQTAGRHCPSQISFETCAGREGNCFMMTCPTNRWTRAAGACFSTSVVRRRVL
jgi:hypothetical protein